MVNKSLVTIIIPSARSDKILRATLDAVFNLNTDFSYDVLVVDKKLNYRKVELCKEFGARYVVQKRPGLVAAYNTGVANASSDLLAFLDDDALPTKHWLQKLVETYNNYSKHYRIGGIGGRVLERRFNNIRLFKERTKVFMPKSIEYIVKYLLYNESLEKKVLSFGKSGIPIANYFIDTRKIIEVEWLNGTNMLIPKYVFKDVKYFDERFSLMFEPEFFIRVRAFGYKLFYNPNALVYHLIHPESRSDLATMLTNNIKQSILFYLENKKYLKFSVVRFSLRMLLMVTALLLSKFISRKR